MFHLLILLFVFKKGGACTRAHTHILIFLYLILFFVCEKMQVISNWPNSSKNQIKVIGFTIYFNPINLLSKLNLS